ncbi:benzoate 4-monooxygenase cytochrome P450 [Purpureocillium lavendulum]|uniref:Benzoate 4-monooxygenase cytochrome P450 n=1 Tax=Purpureocillium lavendulum TaxID=1247861 RepID=A0AB34FWB5_9HYPO|nr:benzoate 4-monooxygenase cytochrome P450 [Purpureocillium lavendulum]
MIASLLLVVAVIPLLYFLQRWNTLRKSPLNKFPGPWHAKWSNFSHSRRFLSGRQPYKMIKLHEKYVRYAPNEVSFSTSAAWRDIYGPRGKDHGKFVKSEFYDGGKFASAAPSIITERDPDKHAVWRKQLSTAFSDRAMRDDVEHVVAGVVDTLIAEVDKRARVASDTVGGGAAINIDPFFNMVTFDIMGHMSLGVDFGCVAKGRLHEWGVFLASTLRLMSVVDALKKFPTLGRIGVWVFSKHINAMLADRDKHEQYSQDLVKENPSSGRPLTGVLNTRRRLANGRAGASDFISHAVAVQRQAKMPVSELHLAAIASDLVIAGTETSATGLSATLYYLLSNRHVVAKLRAELLAACPAYEDLTHANLARLKYLDAVIMEGLRMYPPLPVALHRLVPPAGDTVHGLWLPGGTVVSVNPLAANYSPANFSDPWAYKPERWTDPNCTDDLDACRPFSLGTRNCIGQNLAWMEMRITLAKLLYMFDLELANPDLDWHGESRMHSLWENPPLWVRVARRENNK